MVKHQMPLQTPISLSLIQSSVCLPASWKLRYTLKKVFWPGSNNTSSRAKDTGRRSKEEDLAAFAASITNKNGHKYGRQNYKTSNRLDVSAPGKQKATSTTLYENLFCKDVHPMMISQLH
jgi:hypothetical protein